MTTEFVPPADWDGWIGPSSDPNDEQFGDVIAETTPDDADDFDVVLVGEPFDGAVIGRHGAREGPRALREHLAETKTHHFAAGPVGSIGDLGDVATLETGANLPDDGASVRDVQRRVRGAAARVHDLDAFPVFLGGDNSLTYPNAAPLLDRGSLGAVNVDAHLDVREVRDDATSGTPYRQLFVAGLDAYACVGARPFETSTAYAEFVRERGGEIVTAESVGRAGVAAAADRALDAMAGVDAVYVSVDLDALDAAFAPGVSAPTPGGLSTRDLFALLSRIAGDDRVADRIAGFEVVECAPRLDEGGRGAAGAGSTLPVGGRTAAAGARAVAHFISGRQEGVR